MIYLGEFKAADSVFYAANFHNDTGTIEDPSVVAAQHRAPNGTWTDLTAPTKQNTKVGHYGGTIDTTGFAAGQHVIRMAGTVTTAKAVATEFAFLLVANTAADIYGRVGAPAGASVSADIAAVKAETASIFVDTTEIGAAGAGLTAVPWNASWDAEVQSECTDALNAYDPPTNTEMVAAFTEIKGATWSAATDTLEAIRDRGDAAWATATGFSTHAAADVWAVATRALTDKAGFSLAADQAVNATKINGSATAAARLALSAASIISGTAVAGTLSTTQMTTDLTEATDDHYNSRILIWTSGALTAQATNITDYAGATKMPTFTATTEAPAPGDTFIIV